MGKRTLLVVGVAGVAIALACWLWREDVGQPSGDSAALMPAPPVPPAVPPPVQPPELPAALDAPPAEPVQQPSALLVPDAAGRTVVAADGLSGIAPAPTIGKPVAPVDARWTLRRATDRPDVWILDVVLTTRSAGQSLVATVGGIDGAEVVSGASTTFAEPVAGQEHAVQAELRTSRAAGVVLGIHLVAFDERVRAIRIPLPGNAAIGTEPGAPTGTEPGALPSAGTAPKPAPLPPTAPAPTGPIQTDGVILQPAQPR